jgi:hypothetical protein
MRDPRPGIRSAGARIPWWAESVHRPNDGRTSARAATCNKWRDAHRWITEPTITLLHWILRLRIRRDEIHHALLTLAAAIIC